MLEPALPSEELERLNELRSLDLLDTQAENRFDRLTRIARRLLGVEIALVSLIDADRQWFKSKQGLDAPETPRNISFCGHAILHDQPFVIENTKNDARFADNPLVTGAPHIRFYAGIPLHGPNGYCIGTLCVIDTAPRHCSDEDIAMLSDLAAMAEQEINSKTLNETMRELRESETRITDILKRSNAELQTIIDNMPAMIGYWDTDLRNRFGNRSYLEWFGFTPEQMRGKHIREVIGEERYRLNTPYMQEALLGRPQMFERTIIDQLGVTRHTLASYVPDKDAAGNVVGFYAFVTDVTPLKRAQEAESKAQRQLQSVIDAASEFSIIATEPGGLIRVFSSGAERMLGYRAEEMIDKKTPAVIHVPEEVAARGAELSAQSGRKIEGFDVFVEISRQGGSETREWTYIRKDGSSLPVKLVVTAIHDPSGNLTGFLGVANDITEQKQLQSSLIAARDLAESASRAKSEFVANMSHEIRTPLNAVLGMAHLLGSTPLVPEQKKYLDMIRMSGQSLLAILNDILDFSKIEAGKMELSATQFHIGQVVDALAAIMSVNTGDKDLELSIGIEADVPQVLYGDAMRLQQILTNLIGNAIKFTEHGEVSLLIEQLDRRGDTAHLRFRIRDTGIGMDAKQQTRLFSAFLQADASMTRRFGGTGLGLTICKRLLELMGGCIAVESALGQGSEFSITLPLKALPDETVNERRTTILRDSRFLVVDDNPTSRDYLCKTIGAGRWQADSVESGVLAIERFRARQAAGIPYDAVLVDLNMPGMDGLATMQVLRSLSQGSGVRIMLMTNASGRDQLMQSEAALQADAILMKPVTESSLFDALHKESAKGSAANQAIHAVSQVPASQYRIVGARILLVEDNPLNQIVSRGMLEQAGAIVDAVENGQKAVDRLRTEAQRYDMVLMDVQMPVMDGFKAAQLIREELGLTLPILAMSAGVLAFEQDQCRASGMNDFIAKPIDVNRMFAVIRRHLPSELAAPSKTPAATPAEAYVTQGKVFDPGQLLLVGGDDLEYREKLLEVIGNIIERSSGRFEEAQLAWDERRVDDTARVLHMLRGSVGTLGAQRFAAVALELEKAVRADQRDSIDSLFAVAEHELGETLNLARAWFAQQKNEKNP